MLSFAFEHYLPVASFALAAGGLLVRIFGRTGTPKEITIIAAFIFLLLTSAILWRKDWQAKKLVREVAEEIVASIGNNKRSYDDLLTSLRNRDIHLVSAALDYLREEQRVGSTPEEVLSKDGARYQVKLYYLR
jgi:hypothetical protein